MAKATIPINGEVLGWAIRERGWDLATFAKKVKVEEPLAAAWVSDEVQPSPGQWTRLAEQLKRPKSIFLLGSPPKSGLPPDLRTSAGRRSRDLGPNELLWVRRARRLQRALLEASPETLPVQVPNASPQDAPMVAGRALREWLGVDFAEQLTLESPTAALNAWQAALEAHGVIVMRLPLGGRGIRGFSLRDARAPLIAFNTAEIPQARVFTLMHELAHLSSNTAAACALPPKVEGRKWPVERWCDRVAAHALLPEEPTRALVEEVKKAAAAPGSDLALVMRIANRTHVSLRASALRLSELGVVDSSVFGAINKRYPTRDRDKGSGGGGGGGAQTPEVRLRQFGLAATGLVQAMDEGRINEVKARRVLGLDGHELGDLSRLANST